MIAFKRTACRHLPPWLRNHQVFLVLVLIIMHPCVVSTAKNDITSKCKTCTDIVNNIVEGIKKTAKSNFGGGNTNWEEQKLGSYAVSETRLLEILEGACPDGKECHQMLEENEELIEKWWFKVYPKNNNLDLGTFLCINSLKVCCPEGMFGPECDECAGGKARPCKGNGKCKGDGTRAGVGTCDCSSGYTGELCDECTDKHYEESKNDTHTVCKPCDQSCKDLCDAPGPAGCDECANGWVMTDSGCEDKDECVDDPCQDHEYCTNSQGSYRCLNCDIACSGCSGPGSNSCDDCSENFYKVDEHCKACHKSCAGGCTSDGPESCQSCAEGWNLEDGKCQDIDECSRETSPCKGDSHCINNEGSYKCSTCHYACKGCTDRGADKCIECRRGYTMDDENTCVDDDECDRDHACPGQNTWCVNTIGSYKCDCMAGYSLMAGQCVERAKDVPKKGSAKSSEKSSNKKTQSKKTSQKSDKKNNQNKKTEGKKFKKKGKNAKAESDISIYSQYWFSLVGFGLFGFVLRSSVFLQTLLTIIFWIYLYWFSMKMDVLIKTAS